MNAQALHTARLALAEAALCALLVEAQQDADPQQKPDGISVRIDALGFEVEYSRHGMPIGGEGM